MFFFSLKTAVCVELVALAVTFPFSYSSNSPLIEINNQFLSLSGSPSLVEVKRQQVLGSGRGVHSPSLAYSEKLNAKEVLAGRVLSSNYLLSL